MTLCQQSPEWNLDKRRLFHCCWSSDLGPELVPLKGKETHEGLFMLGLRRMTYSLQIFTGFLLEQSQHECLEPTQTLGPSSNGPAEG